MFTLPYGPEPANVLAPLLGGAIQGIGQGFEQSRKQNQISSLFEKLENAETPIDQIRLISSLPIESSEKGNILKYLSTTEDIKRKEKNREQSDTILSMLLNAYQRDFPGREEIEDELNISTPQGDLFAKEVVTPKRVEPKGLSPEQKLIASTSDDPRVQNVLKAIESNEKKEREEFFEERKFEAGEGKEIKQKITGLRESLPKKRLALQTAREAVESGEVGPLSLANLAERTGIRELQGKSGALLEAASKENLIGNIGRVTARAANQWMEQRINSVFAQVGKKQTANLALQNMLEAEEQMDVNYLNAVNQLEKADIKNNGFVKYSTLDRRARELTEDKNEQILKKLSYQQRQLYEQEQGISALEKNALKKVPKGTPLTIQMVKILQKKTKKDPEEIIELAEQLNYSIPTQEELRSWR